jgi:hypothetical protein
MITSNPRATVRDAAWERMEGGCDCPHSVQIATDSRGKDDSQSHGALPTKQSKARIYRRKTPDRARSGTLGSHHVCYIRHCCKLVSEEDAIKKE